MISAILSLHLTECFGELLGECILHLGGDEIRDDLFGTNFEFLDKVGVFSHGLFDDNEKLMFIVMLSGIRNVTVDEVYNTIGSFVLLSLELLEHTYHDESRTALDKNGAYSGSGFVGIGDRARVRRFRSDSEE